MYQQQQHTQKRSLEIEATFQQNREMIRQDLESLTHSIDELSKKWNVNFRNLRRFAERLGIDPDERRKARRDAGLDKRTVVAKAKAREDQDRVRNPKLLSMPWK